MSATLTATIEGGAPVEHRVTIPANGLEVLPVNKTLGLPDGVPGVITITSDPESQLVTQGSRNGPQTAVESNEASCGLKVFGL